MGTSDRHGRRPAGRGAVPGTPGHHSPREVFARAVDAAARRLEERWGAEWGAVEFGIEDLPHRLEPEDTRIPLGRIVPRAGSGTASNRIVLYRRAIAHRSTDPTEQAMLIRDAIASLVGELLGMAPEDIDPAFEQ